MKGQPVDQIVYDYMFPKPKPNDPQNFHALLQRSLIPEVRQETHAFYGHLETQEAKYPGLDYTHPTHRIRLARWPWHRRLFRAFVALDLTHAEITGLTKWEGTRWAKEKYEKEQGVTIRDTAADGFTDWVEPVERPAPAVGRSTRTSVPVGLSSLIDDDENMDDEDSDGEFLESVGVELNQRLRQQAARREAGETSVVLDEEWEQWLKNAIETGELALVTEQMTDQMLRRGNSSAVIPAALVPPNMLNAARAGRWSEIPEFLQPVLRRALEAEDPARAEAARLVAAASQHTGTATPTSSLRRHFVDGASRAFDPWPRRTYSDLRLPVGGESASSQRTADAPGA